MSPRHTRPQHYDPAAVLHFINQYQQHTGRSPAQREIQHALNISAPSVVHSLLHRLEQQGLLQITSYGRGRVADLALTDAGQALLRHPQAASSSTEGAVLDSSVTTQPAQPARGAAPTEHLHKIDGPIRLVARLPLEEAPTRRRRKTTAAVAPPRELSPEELRERAAWQTVEATGQPVILDDKILLPSGMSPWQAIELLPDGLREQTRAALQQTAGRAFLVLVKGMRTQLIEQAQPETAYAQYRTFSEPAQLAIAETVVRQQLGLPEMDLRTLLVQYGAQLADNDQDRR